MDSLSSMNQKMYINAHQSAGVRKAAIEEERTFASLYSALIQKVICKRIAAVSMLLSFFAVIAFVGCVEAGTLGFGSAILGVIISCSIEVCSIKVLRDCVERK